METRVASAQITPYEVLRILLNLLRISPAVYGGLDTTAAGHFPVEDKTLYAGREGGLLPRIVSQTQAVSLMRPLASLIRLSLLQRSND